MFRILLSLILIVFSVVLDTALLPMVYGGVFAVPVTLMVVMLHGILLGRMSGLLYGTIGGILLDITTGTLGIMMFLFMAIGFLIGVIVYEPEKQYVSDSRRREARQRLAWPALWVFVLYTISEIALLVAQYFYTTRFEWVYLLNLLIRSLIFTAAVTLLLPVFRPVLRSSQSNPSERKVKDF